MRPLPDQESTVKALRLLKSGFDKLPTPFQVVGGLAARAYGSKRPLIDIDLYVPGKSISEIAEHFKEYLEHGPKAHISDKWDITYMSLFFGLQKVEIGDSDSTKIFDSSTNKWIPQNIDYSKSVMIDMYGFVLPVMPIEQLVEYKSVLSRDVDLEDLSEISSNRT